MAEIHVPDGDSHVTVAVGDSVVVRLVEPRANDFQWTTQVDGVAVVEDHSTVHAPRVAAVEVPPGQSDWRLVALKAVDAGPADVTFSLRRVWEDADPVERLRLHVDVRDALFQD